MKYEKNRKIAGIDEFKLQKLAKILILPVIVLILVIVILIIGRKPKEENAAESATAATAAVVGEQSETAETGAEQVKAETEESVAPDENIYVNDFEHYGLQRDAVPEVDELVMKYQRAKTEGDAQLLYEVFGRTDTDGMEETQARMSEEAKVYESFVNTICYTTAGIEKNSYLAFISSNIKFADIDTPAPMLTWAYIYQGADGNYYMKEPDKLNEQEKALLDKVSASEDVTLLDTEMKTNLANAVVNDAKLAALYQMLSENGSGIQTSAAGTLQASPSAVPETSEAEVHIEND